MKIYLYSSLLFLLLFFLKISWLPRWANRLLISLFLWTQHSHKHFSHEIFDFYHSWMITITRSWGYLIFQLLRIFVKCFFQLIRIFLYGFPVALIKGTHKWVIQFFRVGKVVVIKNDQNAQINNNSYVSECYLCYPLIINSRK